MGKSMVAFYSRAHENYVNGTIQELKVGNTEVFAEVIGELTGAELFKIEQEEPYSTNYNECIEQARHDQQCNLRPKLKKYPETLDDYDVIYLGYPNYWSTMPMAVFTFLEHYNFDGKKIKPFCTHEGSGLGGSVADIKKLCPHAVVEKGIAVRGAGVRSARAELEKWI